MTGNSPRQRHRPLPHEQPDTGPCGLLHLFEQEESLAVPRNIPAGSGAGTIDKVALKQDSGSTHSQGGTGGDLHRHPFVPIAVKEVCAVGAGQSINFPLWMNQTL